MSKSGSSIQYGWSSPSGTVDQPPAEQRHERQPGSITRVRWSQGDPAPGGAGVEDADAADVPEHRAGLHREERAIQAAELLHRCLLSLVLGRVSAGRGGARACVARRWRPRGRSQSTDGRRSSPAPRAAGRARRPRRPRTATPGLASAAVRAAATGTSRSSSPCSSSTGAVMAPSIAACDAAAGQHGQQRARRDRELARRRSCSVRRSRASSTCCRSTSAGTRPGSDAAQPQHVHGRLLGGAGPAPSVEQRPAERRHGVQAEGEGDQRVRPRAEAGRQRRVHEHQAGHRLGVPAACMAAIRPPIELPTRIAGRAGDLGQEAVQQLLVGLDRGRVGRFPG